MIINFSVKNFGCIKDEVTLSFEANKSDDLEEYYIIEPKKGLRLLKLGLIFGPNASGKTTVLRALDFLRNLVLFPLEKKTDKIAVEPFLFDATSRVADTLFELEFIHESIKYSYKLALNSEAIIWESLDFYAPRKANVYKRSTDTQTQWSSITFGSKLNISKQDKITLEANTLWNNTVLGAYLKTNVELPELQAVVRWFEQYLQSLITPAVNLQAQITDYLAHSERNRARVVNMLQKADLNITAILFQERSAQQRDTLFQHTLEDETYVLPYEVQSSGTQRYYQLSALLDMMLHTKATFSVDELEVSLHPDLLEHFLLVFLVNAKHTQLIASTHQRELLMKRDMLRHDAIWFTEKQADGGIDLFSLDDFDTSVIRPDTGSIYNAYKNGRLGALPHVGDYYLELLYEEA